jgi:hypothetical protein
MREGLPLALRVGCNNIVAESDSIETIEGCMGVLDGGNNLRQLMQIVWIWQLWLAWSLLNTGS